MNLQNILTPQLSSTIAAGGVIALQAGFFKSKTARWIMTGFVVLTILSGPSGPLAGASIGG